MKHLLFQFLFEPELFHVAVIADSFAITAFDSSWTLPIELPLSEMSK